MKIVEVKIYLVGQVVGNPKIMCCYAPGASILDLSYRTRQKQRVQTVNCKLLSLPLYLVDMMHDVSLKVLNE